MKNTILIALVGLALIAWPSMSRASELDLTDGTATATCVDSGNGACGGFMGTIGGVDYWSFAGLLWSTTTIQPTGSGYIDSFVRIHDSSGNPEVSDGMNTSGALLNDEKPGPTFTHDVLLGDLEVFDVAGTSYYQFLLDINQEGGDPILSLSGLQICTSGKSQRTFVDTCAGGNGANTSTLHYDLDGNTSSPYEISQSTAPVNNVLLDYKMNHGSGSGDLFVYVPTSLLPDDDSKYLYLWSQFGLPDPYENNDGYEEWAFIHAGPGGSDEPFNPSTAPEPASLLLLGSGLIGAAGALRRRNRQRKQQP